MVERRLIEIEGLVQGVGFRPFVHDLATRLELRGSVCNDVSGVAIDVEGDARAIEAFLHQLDVAPPPLAVIERIRLAPAATVSHADFRIAPSTVRANLAASIRVSPDVATCDDCVRELFDANDRRHRYAFLSCSRCGPRLTISLGAPYDRHRTTMRAFPMCDACRREYEDPHDRRFHAQTIACETCGPTLVLRAPVEPGTRLSGDLALQRAVQALRDGAIVAVKGLGGFHLACDATNAEVVRRLRDRKRREAKSFAVMVRDVTEARHMCEISDEEVALLAGPYRPIVLLAKRTVPELEIVADVAPGNPRLGVMLPYTPLHHLLVADVGRPLVMTSGNATDEPIAFRDSDAMARLAGVADLFLLHDREIATRCDDSVVQVVAGNQTVVRRSRGFAPRPVPLAVATPIATLGVGGHLKNTFCLTNGQSAFVSHHVGDLQNAEAFRALEESIAHYTSLFDVSPDIVAHDLHPDYLSTRIAERLIQQNHLEGVGVQHHHAHILSCIAEHGVREPVIGVAFDGAGMGLDGAIWGGEILFVDGMRFERPGHLSYVPLPGGDAAARHPWRAAVAHLWAAYDADIGRAPEEFLRSLDPTQLRVVTQMMARPALAPATSSMGRLFDGVAALLGLHHSAQFEAQAAMALEALADPTWDGSFPVDVSETAEGCIMDSGSFVRRTVESLQAGRPRAQVAASFHNAVADATTDVVMRIGRRTGVRRVALSGGTFQNALLTQRLTMRLAQLGFDVLVQRRVPCNDGGLSLGQAYAAILHATTGARTCA